VVRVTRVAARIEREDKSMKITRRSFVVTGLAVTLPFPAIGHTQTAEDWVTPEEFLQSMQTAWETAGANGERWIP